MHRLFAAIRPPEAIRDLLIDAMDDSADFRWQYDEQLHLTLRFIGEVDRPVAQDIADAFGRIHAEPFQLRRRGVHRRVDGVEGEVQEERLRRILLSLHERCRFLAKSIG